MPEISVVIPSYNHEQFIGRAIQSVLDQSFQNFEIVIVDDASGDDSVSIIHEYMAASSKIKLVSFPSNKGACVAINTGISQSSGKYIAILNSDDMFGKEKLELQWNFLEANHEYAACFTWAELINESDETYTEENYVGDIFEQKNRTRHEWIHHFFYSGNCLCHPSVLIRKECFEAIGLYNEEMTQLPDLEMWIRVCSEFEIYIMPEKLLQYRILKNERNASALTEKTRVRLSYDYYRTMNQFSCLRFEDALKAFPEIKHINKATSKTINYLLALEALKLKYAPRSFWAINTIYNLMRNEESKSSLETDFQFTTADFHRLYSHYDSFGILDDGINETGAAERTQLFCELGDGFNERDSISKKCRFEEGWFSFDFMLDHQQATKNLRWDPLEKASCLVCITSVYYLDSRGNKREIQADEITTYGTRIGTTFFAFLKTEPILFLEVAEPVSSLHISGFWFPLAADTNTLTSDEALALLSKVGCPQESLKYTTKLYLDTGEGYSETNSLTKGRSFKTEDPLIFNLEEYRRKKIMTIRWDPTEDGNTLVSDLRIFALTHKDKVIELLNWTSNAKLANGALYFHDDDPQVIVKIDKEIRELRMHYSLNQTFEGLR